ncbi:hypothetical protein [Geobacter anodireducens]|nr:hypothetical protein [Geobacter anodireducens]
MREDRIRQLIAQEAARLMYAEGVSEYRDAKRKAARRFGPEKSLSLGSHLPSNAEIHKELQRLIAIHEEKTLPERLHHMRCTALRCMEMLALFRPFLVGSVLTGAVTAASDIDLHLFAESSEEVEEFLRSRNIAYETDVVTIRRGGSFVDYSHIYLKEGKVIIECTIYALGDIYRVPKSSITGKPMERATITKLRKLIADTARAEANPANV